jgi:Flp pilus assembly protein TadG
MRTRSTESRASERGQALVFFVIALVAIIGMTGLVLDGGGAFAQRRDEQNGADLAVIGAAVAHANTPGDFFTRKTAAVTKAVQVAAANGYTEGAGGVNVTVTVTPIGNFSARYTVRIDKPHRNSFAGLLGQPSWPVSASAQAVTGVPNGANGVMPLIFNQQAFLPPADPWSSQIYSEPPPGPEDIPQDSTTFNWTVYCTAGGSECNADSDVVSDLIDQFGEDHTVYIGDEINPLNAGSHTTLYGDLSQWIGYEFPVGVVDDDGNFIGVAIFHLVAIDGAPEKEIIGYFTTDPDSTGPLVIGDYADGDPMFAGYIIDLVR